MNKMPGFGFYTDCFGGVRVPESAFYGCVLRARDALAQLKRIYRVTGDETGENMALCAMAEAVYAARLDPGIASATVGSMSVKYDNQNGESLLKIAGRYLEIYRGVGA